MANVFVVRGSFSGLFDGFDAFRIVFTCHVPNDRTQRRMVSTRGMLFGQGPEHVLKRCGKHAWSGTAQGGERTRPLQRDQEAQELRRTKTARHRTRALTR